MFIRLCHPRHSIATHRIGVPIMNLPANADEVRSESLLLSLLCNHTIEQSARQAYLQ
jgi:hypothetical protein